MAWRVLADAVVVFHLLFVAFAVGGGLLVFRRRWVAWLHLPALAWAAFVEFTGRICPLTPLENRLRAAGGQSGYREGFIDHYLLPLLYTADLTRELQWTLGAALVAFNVLVYVLAFVFYRREQR